MSPSGRAALAGPISVLLTTIVLLGSQDHLQKENDFRLAPTAADCTYLKAPDSFPYSVELHRREVSDRSAKLGTYLEPILVRSPLTSADQAPMPRKNLVDDHIFSRLEAAGIQPAPLTSDQEFLRRVTLDLTGRIPSVSDVVNFLSDPSPAKRDNLVDSLMASPEFVDKWTMFFGDLYKVNAAATNVTVYQQGRDAMVSYLRTAISENKPYNEMATDLITAAGDNFSHGEANWVVNGTVPMGPVQDTYDGQAVNLASMFLGINVVDCLLCHDGARHLDTVNLWGKDRKRAEMWGLSAFFAQTRMARQAYPPVPAVSEYVVSDLSAGEYTLNTTNGNRSARQRIGNVTSVVPTYPFTGESIAPDTNRRQALAMDVTGDVQFSRAIVNYIWGKLMVEAFVTPASAFDLARLDPDKPPPAPWTLQPTNPQLLNALSRWFGENGYDLRQLIALIAKSNAYQLSSAYPGAWKPDYVPFYARHFVRRLDAEEIHDAVVKATGILPSYVMDYAGSLTPLPPVSWAMQLPDTREPRTNGTTAQFLNAFGRGDRDLAARNSSGSVLQGLSLMNNTFVMQRIHANNNGSAVQRLLAVTSDRYAIIGYLFFATLGRYATNEELSIALATMQRLGNTRGAEALQWALLNKVDFIYNY